MKKTLIIFFTLGSSLRVFGQCENEYLGYDKQGNLSLLEGIKFQLSNIDTTRRASLFGSLVKTDMTNGIFLRGVFQRSIGDIDGSSRVRLIFTDNSSISIEPYLPNRNSLGLFLAVVTDKYKLLLLKTKVISKIEITGSLLNASTYLADISAMNFLLGMECLQKFL